MPRKGLDALPKVRFRFPDIWGTSVEEAPPPVPGELWRLSPGDDPWGTGNDGAPVRIMDVRDGWVRYDMGGDPFRDERARIDMFVSVYQRVE